MKTQSPIIQVPAAEALHPPGHYWPLSQTFRQDGFYLDRLKREKDVAIYRKTKEGIKAEWLEVVVIRNQEEYTIAGNTVSAREVYPASEKWGTLGWTFNDYQEAFRKFSNLVRVRK